MLVEKLGTNVLMTNVLATILEVWGFLELSGVLCAKETPVSCLGGAGHSCAPGRSLA